MLDQGQKRPPVKCDWCLWPLAVAVPWLQLGGHHPLLMAWPNRKHSLAGRKSCSLTSLLAPLATLPSLPLPLPLAVVSTQRKSTEPPDERRGLPMSRRRIPGLGRRGAMAGGGSGGGLCTESEWLLLAPAGRAEASSSASLCMARRNLGN